MKSVNYSDINFMLHYRFDICDFVMLVDLPAEVSKQHTAAINTFLDAALIGLSKYDVPLKLSELRGTRIPITEPI